MTKKRPSLFGSSSEKPTMRGALDRIGDAAGLHRVGSRSINLSTPIVSSQDGPRMAGNFGGKKAAPFVKGGGRSTSAQNDAKGKKRKKAKALVNSRGRRQDGTKPGTPVGSDLSNALDLAKAPPKIKQMPKGIKGSLSTPTPEFRGSIKRSRAATRGSNPGVLSGRDLVKLAKKRKKNGWAKWDAAHGKSLSNTGASMDLAKLSKAERDSLPTSAFVFPAKRRFPIHDENHARAALMDSHGAEHAVVKAAVLRRYPHLAGK